MRLLLVRHAESTWNATGRWQGQSDVPLSPRGQLQTRALATRMFGVPFDVRVCSDLGRAVETAAALGELAEPDPRFREIDVGEWSGLERGEVAERFPDQLTALRSGAPVRIGGGESMREFEGRVDAAVDALRAEHAGRRVLLVTHGGVVRALAARALGTRSRVSPLVGVANTSLSVLSERDGALEIVRYNDAAHLAAADQDSAIFRVPEPTTRVALVACEDADADRHLTDGLLVALGIAQYYALAPVASTPLAGDLPAHPLPGDDGAAAMEPLREEHEMGVFGILMPPEEVRRAVASALGLPGVDGLAIPPHGAVAQLRLSSLGATMHSYGLRVDAADPLAG